MRITITKGRDDDRMDICRADGTSVASRFPHKGPIPHDFVHFAVERELGLADAFWGLVAAGHHPEAIQDIAKAAGHASAKRTQLPASGFVSAIQAERIVEAFEADHWSGASGDPAGVTLMAEAGCAQSVVPLPPALDADAVIRIRACLDGFARRWSELPIGEAIAVEWNDRQ